MARRSAVLVAGILVFALGACSDSGGGDDEAFCDALDNLSGQVADGDLATENGLEDATDTANDLLEAANSDQEDAVTNVGEALQDADPDNAADTAETIQDELGDFADDCDLDDFAEAPDEETTTTTEADETTTTGDDETTTTEGDGETGDLNIVSGVVDPSAFTVEPGFEDNVNLCFQGFMQACDDLFFGSDDGSTAAAPDGSDTRNYGGSCGGRVQFNNETVRCTDNLFAAAPVDASTFDDPSFEQLAQACQGNADADIDGDMQACDDLFLQTGVGTPEEAYGDTCGGRIDSTVADRSDTCVNIFGPTAVFG